MLLQNRFITQERWPTRMLMRDNQQMPVAVGSAIHHEQGVAFTTKDPPFFILVGKFFGAEDADVISLRIFRLQIRHAPRAPRGSPCVHPLPIETQDAPAKIIVDLNQSDTVKRRLSTIGSTPWIQQQNPLDLAADWQVTVTIDDHV